MLNRLYDKFMSDVSLAQKVFQLFITGLGSAFFELRASGSGGVIFFADDFKNSLQFKRLLDEVKNGFKVIPFLSIDQEGGRVQRIRVKEYLSARETALVGEEFALGQTAQMAQELKYYGLNLNFAPVLDVDTNPQNPVIGVRSYGNKPEIVSKFGKIVWQTYLKNGIIPCAKHFPGHGETSSDSHLCRPVVDLPFDEFEKLHIKPFLDNLEIPMMMISHVYYTCFDNENIPASASRNILSYLRKRYKGIIISDDMLMEGIKGHKPKDLLLAGVDMFIYRHGNKETFNLINELVNEAKKDSLLRARIDESFERVMNLKKILEKDFFVL